MDDLIPVFMDITSVADTQVAQQFIEMAGGDLETAVGLYFEHGASAAIPTESSNNEGVSGNENTPAVDDEQLAQQLQQELYKQQDTGVEEIRRPIEPTRDTLVPQEWGGFYHNDNPLQQQFRQPLGGMFGRAQRSVFNQDVIDLDSDRDDDEEGNGNSDDEYQSNMTATQRRLANIFRPPWDLISKVDLDTAKHEAASEGKWVLINVQDVSDFRCQCLNRDFWSNPQIKEVVRANFVFVQYHSDSPSGESYRTFYPFDDFPHIAIIDPITGERMLMWNENPPIIRWIEQVVEFLDKYDDNVVAPDATGLNSEHPVDLVSDEDDDDGEDGELNEKVQEEDDDDDEDDNKSENNGDVPTTNSTSQSGTAAIAAVNHPDPPADTPASETTRVQIRAGDGRRVVKRVLLSDTVRHLFEFAKFHFAIPDNQEFTLKSQGKDLASALEDTIDGAGLKNASLMIETL